MGIRDFFRDLFIGKAPEITELDLAQLHDCYTELYFRELAFWSCVNLVSKTISKCEFQTYVDKKSVKSDEYYTWNVETNQNQSSSVFLHKLLAKLYQDNEALVIEVQGGLHVVDSFTRKKYTVYGDTFSQVTIDGFLFEKTFRQDEVLYFSLTQQDMRKVMNGIYETYQKLISYSMDMYEKQSGTKYKLHIGTLPVGEEKIEEMVTNTTRRLKSFMQERNAAFPEHEGFSLEELGNKTYSRGNSRDIRSIYDDVFEFTAIAFGIPPVLITGKVENVEVAMKQFITNAILPIIKMLQQEINRKRTGKVDFLSGTYLKIDTTGISFIDVVSNATALDKLVSSGLYCINDIREICGDEPINEAWAYKHFMTKNYMEITNGEEVSN